MIRNITPGNGIRIGLIVLGTLLLGCAGGSGGGNASGDSPPGGSVTPSTEIGGSWVGNGQLYARVELPVPAGDSNDANSFTLRSTIPVPKNFLSSSPQSWAAIVDSDGSLVPAQIERVARYATGESSVVEVIARVRRSSTTPPGSRVSFDLVGIDFTSGTPPTTGPVLNIPAEIVPIANGSRKILVAATDVFGNLYLGSPISKENLKAFRDGPYLQTYRTYHKLIPVTGTPGPSAPLPALLGMHAYVTVGADRALGLDLRFHNGMVADTPGQQDAIRKLYFEKIELWLPPQYTARLDLEDPSFDLAGAHPVSFGGKDYNAIPLVKALPGGKMHFIPPQGQFHRRIGIASQGDDAAALSLVEQEGLGFVRQAVDASTQQELYSWWNPATSNYLPQRMPLANYDFWGHTTVLNRLKSDFNYDRNVILAGAAPGAGWHSGDLGWANPAGTPYGGMTGGTLIELYQGLLEAYSGSHEGYRNMSLMHRASVDRQPDVLFYNDGEPVSVRKLAKINPQGKKYIPCTFFLVPKGQGPAYFGLNKPATAHENFVASQGLNPPYEQTLANYDPHDLQHYIRYLRQPIVLAWLGNDALAKDDLLAAAELARLSFPDVCTSVNGNVSGLLGQLNFSNAHPNIGLGYGRGEAWGLYANVASFALADDTVRADLMPWMKMQAQTLSKGQVSCTGIIEAKTNSKFPDQGLLYRMRQVYEDMITQNACLGSLASVFQGTGVPEESLVRDVVVQLSYSIIIPIGWVPNHGPLGQQAIGPIDINQPIFCVPPLPPQGSNHNANLFQTPSSFGQGFVMTGDSTFIAKAIEAFGGSVNSLKSNLEDTHWSSNNYPNTMVLLRTMQDLGWTQP